MSDFERLHSKGSWSFFGSGMGHQDVYFHKLGGTNGAVVDLL